MNKENYLKIRKQLIKLADGIMDAKQPEYTNNHVDVLHNFKSSAERAGIDPLQCWIVFLDKQVQSIITNAKNPNMLKAEPIESRYADAINYLVLGLALTIDRNKSLHEDLNLIYKSIE